MAKFKKHVDAMTLAIESIANDLEVARNEASTAHLFNKNELNDYLSMESAQLNHVQMSNYNDGMTAIADHLESVFAAHNLSNIEGGIPAHSLEAAQILLAASGDLAGYNRKQMNAALQKDVPVLSFEGYAYGPYGDVSIAENASISKESFDEKVLDKYLNYSIIFNVLASRQDEFSALFFKPLTITPDEVGYIVNIRMEQVWNGVEHLPNGQPKHVVKRNLIDALTHPEVLETNSTEIIPFVQEGGTKVGGVDPIKNVEHFLDDASAAVRTLRNLDGIDVLSAPLKTNMEHNLLGLSSHPSLIANGLMNEKDSLDSRVALENIYLEVDGKFVKFNTHLLRSSAFYRAIEGHMREIALTFDNGSFLATKNRLAMDGTEVPVFKALEDAGYALRFRVRGFGKGTVELGNVEIVAAPVEVSSVYKDGVEVSLEDPALKAIIGGLDLGKPTSKVKFVGYDLEARRTNYDLRSRGLLLDSTEYREQFVVPLRSPISIQKPIVDVHKEHPDVKALVNATRIQANNDAVTTVLNHAALMEELVSKYNFVDQTSRDSFPGIGRYFLVPCFLREKLHLPALVSSVSSENRLKDIQGGITTKLNEMVGRILQETNYIPVVEQMTGGNVGKIKVAIGTDYRLPQYLNIQGDTRLFGGKMEYEIASTPNKLMRNKIVVTLTRVNSDEGPDPFSYGTFIWTPELMVSTQLSYGAQTYHQHLVHPRYMHVVNIPIIAVVDITGIEEVTGESTVLPVVVRTADEVKEYGNKIENTTIFPEETAEEKKAREERNKRNAINGKPVQP